MPTPFPVGPVKANRDIPERNETEIEEDAMRLAWAALNKDNIYAEKVMAIYRRNREQLEDLCFEMASGMARLFNFDNGDTPASERLAIWGPNGEKALEGAR